MVLQIKLDAFVESSTAWHKVSAQKLLIIIIPSTFTNKMYRVLATAAGVLDPGRRGQQAGTELPFQWEGQTVMKHLTEN